MFLSSRFSHRSSVSHSTLISWSVVDSYSLRKLYVIFVSGLLFQGKYWYFKTVKVSVLFLMKVSKHNVISSLSLCMFFSLPSTYCLMIVMLLVWLNLSLLDFLMFPYFHLNGNSARTNKGKHIKENPKLKTISGSLEKGIWKFTLDKQRNTRTYRFF